MGPILTTNIGTLYNASCIDVLSNMDDNALDCVITSPPYNVGIDYDSHNDTMPVDEYFDFIREVFTLIFQKLKPSGRVAINIIIEANMKNNGGRMLFVSEYNQILKDIGYGFGGIVDLVEEVPHRSRLTAWGSWLSPSAPYIYNPKECVLLMYKDTWKKQHQGNSYFTKPRKKEFMECVSGMWKYRAETKGLTKANFSLDIPMKALKILTWENDLVYDPFMGSGTTAIACEQLNRRWIGSEISKQYCDVIKKRIGTEHDFF